MLACPRGFPMPRLPVWLLVSLVGCADDAGEKMFSIPDLTGTGDTTDTDVPDPTNPADTDDTDPTGTTTPGTRAGCDVDPALAVLSVTPEAGLVTTFVEVAVELSAPSSAAVQCTSVADPTEISFGESTDVATSHAIRLEGLIPGTEYACSAAPVCPAQAGPATAFTYTTGAPPGDMRRLTVQVDPVLGMEGSWTLAPYTLDPFTGDTWLAAWGPDGTLRWWWPLPEGVGMWIELLWYPEQGEVVWGGGMHEQGRIRRVSLWDGETYAWAPPGWQQEQFHHDGRQIDDGRLLTLEIRENSQGKTTWDGFGIRLHDPVTGLVDFDYDSQALVDAGHLPPGDGGFFGSDPWHANWIGYHDTPAGPEAYVSLCFSQQILALDGITGDLKWQLGRGLGWTVLDANGIDIGENALPQCQHGLEVVGSTILVYDNGQDRATSSASEWEIDPLAMTATRTWYWTEPGWKEDYIGDIDYLPNDRILVTEATQKGQTELVEVDRATGAAASRVVFASGGTTYRSERYAGCDMFTSVKECETLAARYAEVAELLATGSPPR